MARFGCSKVLTYSSENDLPTGWFLHQKLCGSPDVFIHLQEITILGRELCNSKLIDYHHAILKRISSNGKLHIQVEDNSSIYGTFLNGTKLEDDELVALKEQDTISLGHPEVTESSFILKYCYRIEDGQIRKEPRIVIVYDKIEDTTCTEAESLETIESMDQITAPKTKCKRASSENSKKPSMRRSPTRESSPEDAVLSSEEHSGESNDSCYGQPGSLKGTSDDNSNTSSVDTANSSVASVSNQVLKKELLSVMSYNNIYGNIDSCSVTSVESSSSSPGSKRKAKASRADAIGYDNESSSSDSSSSPPDVTDDSKFIKDSPSSDSGSCSDTSVIVDDSSSISSWAENTVSIQKDTISINASANRLTQSGDSTASEKDISATKFKNIIFPDTDSSDSIENGPENLHTPVSEIEGGQCSTIPFSFNTDTLEQELPKETYAQNFNCDNETSQEMQVKSDIIHKSSFDDSRSPSLLHDFIMTIAKRKCVDTLPSPSFLSNELPRSSSSLASSTNEEFTKLKPALDTNSKSAGTSNSNISNVSASHCNGPNSPEVVVLLDTRNKPLHPTHKYFTVSVTNTNQPLPVASSPENIFFDQQEKITDFEFRPEDFASMDDAEFDSSQNPDIICEILPVVGTNDSNVAPSHCNEPRPNISESVSWSPLPKPKICNELYLTPTASPTCSPTASKVHPVIISPTSLYSQKQGINAVKRPAASLSKLSRKRLKLDSNVSRQTKRSDTTTVSDASRIEVNSEHSRKDTDPVNIAIPSLLTPDKNMPSDNKTNERVIRTTPNVNQSDTSPTVNANVDSQLPTFVLSPTLKSYLNRVSVIQEPNTNTSNVNQSDTLPTTHAYVDSNLPTPTINSYLNGVSVIQEPDTNKRRRLFQEKQPVPPKTMFVPYSTLDNVLNPKTTTVQKPIVLPSALNRNPPSASPTTNDNSALRLPIFNLSSILKDHLNLTSAKQEEQTHNNHLNSSVPQVTSTLYRILSTKSPNVPSNTPEKLSDNHLRYESRYQTQPTNLVTNQRPKLQDPFASLTRIIKEIPSTSNGYQSGTHPASKVHPEFGKSIPSTSTSSSTVQAKPGLVLNEDNLTRIIPHIVPDPQGNTDHIEIRGVGAIPIVGTTKMKPKTKTKKRLSSKQKRALNILKDQDLSGFSASYRKRYRLPVKRKKKKSEKEKTLTKDNKDEDQSDLLNIDPEN